ncbi:hypothetical protein [Actinomycetospora flava]|uniref:DivIVA domain-containing protein n=1 Tax=Actinomycetospora flava TaxID=3129232 RepID=A0ABU8MF46_9PSEU
MSETTRFSVNLDADDDTRFERLVRGLADDVGRVPSHRGRRYPSRADLLRAMLAVTERDPEVRAAVHAHVRSQLDEDGDR